MIETYLVSLITWSAIVVLMSYVLINGFYFVVHLLSIFELRSHLDQTKYDPNYRDFDSPFLPGIAILIPVFNEEQTIVETVRSLLDQNYPDTEIIVINDGSTDDTFAKLKRSYDLTQVATEPPWDLDCAPVRAIYRSERVPNLYLIDKVNGGKADALNAGVGFTNQPLFCSIDADSLIDRDGLRRCVVPFLKWPERTIASGGTVRLVNSCSVEGGQVFDVEVADRPLLGMQEIEYLRAFYSGRLGYKRLRSLFVISGTFGLFKRTVVEEVGGYSTETVSEDLELVVRLHRHMMETNRTYSVEFVPEPVVWTQAPESWSDLSRQRRRWYRGLLEVFARHWSMLGNPRYGTIGVLTLPLFFLSEAIGPQLETYGYIIVPTAFFIGMLNIQFFIMFILIIMGIGVFLSWFGIFSEVWSYRRYDDPGDIASLFGYATIENFGYRQWKALISTVGLFEFLTKKRSWGVISRKRFDEE